MALRYPLGAVLTQRSCELGLVGPVGGNIRAGPAQVLYVTIAPVFPVRKAQRGSYYSLAERRATGSDVTVAKSPPHARLQPSPRAPQTVLPH